MKIIKLILLNIALLCLSNCVLEARKLILCNPFSSLGGIDIEAISDRTISQEIPNESYSFTIYDDIDGLRGNVAYKISIDAGNKDIQIKCDDFKDMGKKGLIKIETPKEW